MVNLMSFEEFCATFTPSSLKKSRAISFEKWLRDKGEHLPHDLLTLEIEILFGVIQPHLTRAGKGKITAKMETVQRVEALRTQYYAEVPEIETVYLTHGEQAAAQQRVAYKRYLRSLATKEEL